jgi:hypothetical protein
MVAAAGIAIDLAVNGAGGNQPGSSAGGSGRSPGASSSSPSTQADSPALPSSYVGRWNGTLQDLGGLEGDQTADLTLSGGTVGTVVGTASYPAIGCTYDFRLVSLRAGVATIFEDVQSGLCISEYVVLTPDGQGLKDDVYNGDPAQGGHLSFTGRLSRVSSFG